MSEDKDKEEKQGKPWVKILLVTIPALFSFLAVIFTVWIQVTSAKQLSVDKVTYQNDQIIKQLNEEVIPEIKRTMTLILDREKTLTEEIILIRERLARMEGRWESSAPKYATTHLAKGVSEPKTSDTEEKSGEVLLKLLKEKPSFKIPNLDVQQMKE
jgi:hypothetical protein